jgi:hypothetical protein
MMGGEYAIKSFSAAYPDWDFLALATNGKSEGFLTGWRKQSLHLLNSWLCLQV